MPLALVFYSNDIEALASFYKNVFQFSIADSDESYIRLLKEQLEIVILQAPDQYKTTTVEARESTAIKPVFFTESEIDEIRNAVVENGGFFKSTHSEWQFNGHTVCDGHDIEGNIFQVRTNNIR